MGEWKATAILIGLFALRCVLPLVLTIVIATLMNRMLDRWEVQEAEKKASAAPPAAVIPLRGKRPSLACWVLRSCDASNCPAYHNATAPCWQLRSAAEGRVPAECADCELYTGTVVAA